ncbi:hypothetical protein [Streptomyces sp. NPDC052494]|uniref:hypothetical protein n=1 Tax=Streptomyces sp. NPDC052494 TaxID=3365692 RepID=UPI0037D2BA8A
MPVVSIDSARERLGYGIPAEETYWCSLGILSTRQLQQSEDEQLLADIYISAIRGNTQRQANIDVVRGLIGKHFTSPPKGALRRRSAPGSLA